MPRERKARTWVKVDCDGILHGSINYLLTLEGQAIWLKMIAFSEVCGGRPGYIEDNNNKGLPREYVAHELHCTVESLNKVIDIMISDGALNITNGTGSVHLVNFSHYQFSEYDRQRPYREAKKQKENEETLTVYIESHLRSEFMDIDVDEELKKFHLYWSEGKRKLQRPKTAFRNWLVKAREYKGKTTLKSQGVKIER